MWQQINKSKLNLCCFDAAFSMIFFKLLVDKRIRCRIIVCEFNFAICFYFWCSSEIENEFDIFFIRKKSLGYF